MVIDTEAIEEHIRDILKALGDNPAREGLKIHLYELRVCIKKYLYPQGMWNL